MPARSAADGDAVVFERHTDVMVVRLNSPSTRNALQPAVKQHLELRIPELLTDPAVRCLVITGSEDSFCAGGDINKIGRAHV